MMDFDAVCITNVECKLRVTLSALSKIFCGKGHTLMVAGNSMPLVVSKNSVVLSTLANKREETIIISNLSENVYLCFWLIDIHVCTSIITSKGWFDHTVQSLLTPQMAWHAHTGIKQSAWKAELSPSTYTKRKEFVVCSLWLLQLFLVVIRQMRIPIDNRQSPLKQACLLFQERRMNSAVTSKTPSLAVETRPEPGPALKIRTYVLVCL